MLIKDLHRDTEDFILSGRLKSHVLDTLTAEESRVLEDACRTVGLELKYRHQSLEYMHKKAKIRYPRICNPRTKTTVSFIPWFSLPQMPYPVFVYLYAVWHYINTLPRSMELSASVAGKIFGVESFHKSTVSRNAKLMEDLLRRIDMDRPLSAVEQPTMPTSEAIIWAVEFMAACQSIESLADALGIEVGIEVARSASTVGADSNGALSHALSQIPLKLSKAVKEKTAAGNATRDTRKRPARRRRDSAPHEKPTPAYVASHEIERLRTSFISVCKAAVFDMATTYHRFLI